MEEEGELVIVEEPGRVVLFCERKGGSARSSPKRRKGRRGTHVVSDSEEEEPGKGKEGNPPSSLLLLELELDELVEEEEEGLGEGGFEVRVLLVVVELVEVEVSFPPPPMGMTIVVPGRGIEIVIPPPPSSVVELELEELELELELVESVVGEGVEGSVVRVRLVVVVVVDVGDPGKLMMGTVRVISAPPGKVITVVVKPLGNAVEVWVVGLVVGCRKRGEGES